MGYEGTTLDLRNTIWLFEDRESAIASQGAFIAQVNGSVTAYGGAGLTETFEFTDIALNYTYDGAGWVTATNKLFFYNEKDGKSTYIDAAELAIGYFKIKFADGTGIDNSVLLSWVGTNGKRLEVEDLTNTTWYVPAGWEAEAGYDSFKISYYPNNRSYRAHSLWLGYTATPINELGSATENSLVYADDEIGISSAVGVPSTEAFILASIEGTDTTNPKLIAWLSKWGELQEEKITDLTGYTVTVPAGWSAPVGSVQCYIDFTYNGFNYNFFGCGLELSPAPDGVEIVPSSNSIVFCNQQPVNVGYIVFDNGVALTTGEFTISITGGNDVSNPSLIQWFVDNNATFTPPSEPEEPDFEIIPGSYTFNRSDLIASISGFSNVLGYLAHPAITNMDTSVAVQYVLITSGDPASVQLDTYVNNNGFWVHTESGDTLCPILDSVLTIDGNFNSQVLLDFLTLNTDYEEVNAEEKPNGATFDLSTLGLSVGTHTIYVKLRNDDEYLVSEKSNEVSYNILGVLLAPSTQYMYKEGKIRIYNDNDGLICNLYYNIQAETQTLSDVKTQSSVVKNHKLICDDVSISNLVKAELS
jgi:hypothetical protein